MSVPLLAIEAGNSRLKFGLFVPSRTSFFRRVNGDVVKVTSVREDWPNSLEHTVKLESRRNNHRGVKSTGR